MTLAGYRRTVVVLSFACAVSGLLCGWCFVQRGLLGVRVAFAQEQIEIIEDMRVRALQSGTADAAGYLRYAVNYYPSGTKQPPGSRLDRLVESARQRAVREILAHLRSQTGENLGDEPGPWIERHASE